MTCQCYYEDRHIIANHHVSLLSNDVMNHGPVVTEFSDWCKHFLDINVSKIKEEASPYSSCYYYFYCWLCNKLPLVDNYDDLTLYVLYTVCVRSY